MIPQQVLQAFNISEQATLQAYGSGHIHKTYKVQWSGKNRILQRINHYVFKNPQIISHNIKCASEYLSKHYPDYLFLSPIVTVTGTEYAVDPEGFSWRMFPFIENTKTINEVNTVDESYEASKGFAKLSKNLADCDTNLFKATIERFHDLGWRYEQFESALDLAKPDRITQAADSISQCKDYFFLVTQYDKLVSSGDLTPRIMHNDTKINNILFDKETSKAACVIDLDTLMPGYFIYDLGDMVRTFVSPASESESDLTKIIFRKEIYDALVEGYLSEMSEVLTESEISAIPFSGLMMTYMIGLRFLTDFLNGDVYFSTSYPLHNLDRAKNQFKLLDLLKKELL